MLRPAMFLLLLSSWCAVARGVDSEDEAEFHPLFNGRDLSGWVLVNTPTETWSVQDEMLVCSGKPIGEIRTDRMYQNFVLELEWRHMVPKGNAGVFVWADDITARGVPFHRSIEVQVLENAYGNGRGHTTHGDIFPIHGATMTPHNGRGGSRAFPTEHRSNPSPEWNHYRITCQDGSISLAVNGKVVTRGEDCSPRKGYICLESEGGIVHYRNLRIQELPDTPVEPEHVATAARGFRSLYTGLDLSGWTGSEQALPGWESRDWVLAHTAAPDVEDTSLSTTESFGNFGFVFDVRLREADSTGRVVLRDGTESAVEIDLADARIEPHLVPQGQWNRLEGTLVENRLSLSVNGENVMSEEPLDVQPGEGPLTLKPQGVVDFANIYAREIEKR